MTETIPGQDRAKLQILAFKVNQDLIELPTREDGFNDFAEPVLKTIIKDIGNQIAASNSEIELSDSSIKALQEYIKVYTGNNYGYADQALSEFLDYAQNQFKGLFKLEEMSGSITQKTSFDKRIKNQNNLLALMQAFPSKAQLETSLKS